MNNLNIMMNGKDCTLSIKWHKRTLYVATMEMAHLQSKFAINGELLPYFYYPTETNEDGELLSNTSNPVYCALKVVEIHP